MPNTDKTEVFCSLYHEISDLDLNSRFGRYQKSVEAENSMMSSSQVFDTGTNDVKMLDYTTPTGALLPDNRAVGLHKDVSCLNDSVEEAKQANFDNLLSDIFMVIEGTATLQISRRLLSYRFEKLSPAEQQKIRDIVNEPTNLEKLQDRMVVTRPRVTTRRGPSAFHLFSMLPKEVRIMIWNLALPNLVESIQDERAHRFIAPGPRNAILDICGHDYPEIFHMKPIYLPLPLKQGYPLVDGFYIRPEEDIVYLNTEALYNLDIKSFIKIEANQVIQNLALPVVPVERMRWCGEKLGREPGTRTWLGELVRGLRNLKKLYVVEGHMLHNESEVEYWSRHGRLNKFRLELEDVKTEAETRDWAPSLDMYSPPARPWNQDYAITVEELFKDEVSRELSKKYPVIFEGPWNVPEVICKEIKRFPWEGCDQHRCI